MKRTTLTLTTLLCLTTTAHAQGDTWHTDFAKAQELAAKENKSLLLNFTGSDWCGFCVKLQQEVFSKPLFKKEIGARFILVELDFPQEVEQSAALQKQNGELMNRFQVQGFPTIVLTDATGLPYAQTGYQEGGPELYLEHLKVLQGHLIRRDEALAKAAPLKGIERAKALHEALQVIGPALQSHYGKIIDEIIGLDADGKAGLRGPLLFARDLRALKTEVDALAVEEKWDAVVKRLTTFIEERKPKGEQAQELWFIKGIALIQGGKKDEGLAAMESGRKLDPSSEMGRRIAMVMEQVKGM